MGSNDGIWPPPAIVGKHRPYVDKWPDEDLWDAVCEWCGWESVEHEEYDSADTAADEHRHAFNR